MVTWEYMLSKKFSKKNFWFLHLGGASFWSKGGSSFWSGWGRAFGAWGNHHYTTIPPLYHYTTIHPLHPYTLPNSHPSRLSRTFFLSFFRYFRASNYRYIGVWNDALSKSDTLRS